MIKSGKYDFNAGLTKDLEFQNRFKEIEIELMVHINKNIREAPPSQTIQMKKLRNVSIDEVNELEIGATVLSKYGNRYNEETVLGITKDGINVGDDSGGVELKFGKIYTYEKEGHLPRISDYTQLQAKEITSLLDDLKRKKQRIVFV